MNETPSAAPATRAPHPAWTLAVPGPLHQTTQPDVTAQSLAQDLGLPLAIAALLICRGFRNAADTRAYLHPDIDQMHDPMTMLGMPAAVDRLRTALQRGEPILIYGDYDVDGTVATVLLKTAAQRAAAAMGVTPDVRYHIPHRIREGYGMQELRIEAAAAEGVRLIISVDTGIRAFAAAHEARRVGVDLIVTDHHLPDGAEGIPDALAVVNPNQPGCSYPYKDLCGAGVAFKLAQALLESVAQSETEKLRLREKTLPSFLKLLAIATIADAVPLTGENRTIAAVGLRELRKPAQPGLRALMDLAQIDTSRPISAMDVGFRLAPRINAAGRMDIASDVVEMFLSTDPATAQQLAQKLHRLNDERRATEAEALRAIEAQLEAMAATAAGLGPLLVLDDAPAAPEELASTAPSTAPITPTATSTAPALPLKWHRGIVGILASRVVERTGRPALVITHEAGEATGSGRSVTGFHLLDALTAVHAAPGAGPLFLRFGGHAHAVGFSLVSDRVQELRRRLVQYATDLGIDHTLAATLDCDAELRLSDITPDFLTALEQLGPFGSGNHDPLFITKDLRLTAPVKVIQDRHLRLQVEDPEDGTRFSAMAWTRRTDWAAKARDEAWTQGQRLDLAYRLRRNWHPDFGGWEMDIVAMAAATPAAEPATASSAESAAGCSK